jgi:hypothetical protein
MAQVIRWSGTTSSAAHIETKARNTALWWISAAIGAIEMGVYPYTATEIKCVCYADMVS